MNTQFRTQLYLDEERYLWIREKANIERKSIAQVVRDVVDQVRGKDGAKIMEQKEKIYQKIMSLAGKFKDKSDVGKRHDYYLGEALYKEIRRNRKR